MAKAMALYICSKCGGNCDAGELRGGVCCDCIDKLKELEIKAAENRKMFARCTVEQVDGQLIIGGLTR